MSQQIALNSLSEKVQALRVTRTDPEGAEYTLDVPRLEVAFGEKLAIVGESGSGTSTLLEMLGLLSWPSVLERFRLYPFGDSRHLDLTDALMAQDVNTLTGVRASCIGFVTQDGGLMPYLSVQENACLAVKLAGGDAAAAGAGLKPMAQALGIGGLLHRRPARLSGGQRQRAAVLRQLARAAESAGGTVILASHNEPLLREFGYRILRLRVQRGPRGALGRLTRGEGA